MQMSMSQHFEPSMEAHTEMDMIRDIYYRVKEINFRVGRLEDVTTRVEDVWQKQIDALEKRVTELEKFRFLFTVLSPPAWAVALLAIGLELRRALGTP